jgi:hypothetical protein
MRGTRPRTLPPSFHLLNSLQKNNRQ